MLTAIIVLSLLCLLLALAVWRRRDLLEVTFLEGRRAGLKQAVEAARERGDVAIMMAPPGLLLDGVQRAQTAHQIEMDLRGLLQEVR